ncbi:MAG: 4-alpha-glucanotransferase [Acidimicrobiales bacterium]
MAEEVDPEPWGVARGYHDALGAWREVPDATISGVLASMGAARRSGPDDDEVPIVTLRLDHPMPALDAGTLILEDGGSVEVGGPAPPDLPAGYHLLQRHDGRPDLSLVVSPGRCPRPAGRGWGWAAQLYASRSRDSWGMGDLADLRSLGEWSASLGASMTLINPLHATPPGPHPEPSPYFASSRCFANPLYLRVEDVPGAQRLEDLDALAASGRALNRERHIDRDKVWALKSPALETLFAAFDGDAGFDSYCAERGRALQGFATFSALAEQFGVPWQDWPEPYRRPESPAVAELAASPEGRRRLRFHAWLQWQIDRQLAAAADALPLVQDLAIGVNAGGADAWLYQDAFAAGMRVGAPPDEFNTLGQDWGLPPWDPWRLRAAGYAPFIETVRAGFRHTGGLRFDHVMGLFRLFWIPDGGLPAEGAYVRYPYWDLLNILALEAQRAGAYVVGEDLGTVEDHVRAELAGRQVLSYRLLWFEPERPPHWPDQALGSVTTHDLPTIAGVWSGADLQVQQVLGLSPNEEAATGLRRRLEDWAGVAPDAPVEEVVTRTYASLAGAPSDLLTATLDDAAAVEERPNMPGTTDEWPNWSMALPVPLEELESSTLAGRIAAVLGARTAVTDPGS